MMQDRFLVDLGDERAGRVENEDIACWPRPRARCFGTPCAEKTTGRFGLRDLLQLLDEDRALRLQALHHVAVVHDLVAHIDGRAEALERLLDDLDRALHPGAEAARGAEQNLEFWAAHPPRT